MAMQAMLVKAVNESSNLVNVKICSGHHWGQTSVRRGEFGGPSLAESPLLQGPPSVQKAPGQRAASEEHTLHVSAPAGELYSKIARDTS